jgi:hypothetical protein
MRNSHHIDPDGMVTAWQQAVRGSLIVELDRGTAIQIARRIVVAAGSTGPTVAAALAAGQGATMINATTATSAAANAAAGTGATVAASASSSLAAKIAAGTLVAALTAGGAAAVTGTLPDGMQSFAADAAAHIGIDLPRPAIALGLDADVDASLGLGVGEVFDFGAAGRLSATADASSGLVVTGIEEAAGFTASILHQTRDSVTVQFASATDTKTVVLTSVDGATVTDTGLEADASSDASTHESSTSPTADTDASTSVEGGGATVDGGLQTTTDVQIGLDG